MRVAYCGGLYAGVVLEHRDGMEVRVTEEMSRKDFRAQEPQEAELTLVLALLLQRLLEHDLW